MIVDSCLLEDSLTQVACIKDVVCIGADCLDPGLHIECACVAMNVIQPVLSHGLDSFVERCHLVVRIGVRDTDLTRFEQVSSRHFREFLKARHDIAVLSIDELMSVHSTVLEQLKKTDSLVARVRSVSAMKETKTDQGTHIDLIGIQLALSILEQA